MIEKPFYVYAIFRPDGTPCYVGKGKGARWQHNGKYGRNHHLLRIIANAKSASAPVDRIKLIENLSEPDALALEAFFIAAIGRQDRGGPLVNLTDGGEVGPTGYRHPPELQARHSARRAGRPLTPEWKAAVSDGLRGRSKSPEHVAKATHLHSEESKRKIRDAKIRRDAKAVVKTSPAYFDRNSVRYQPPLAA